MVIVVFCVIFRAVWVCLGFVCQASILSVRFTRDLMNWCDSSMVLGDLCGHVRESRSWISLRFGLNENIKGVRVLQGGWNSWFGGVVKSE